MLGGKQVKLYLVEGTPGGLTTAEITNWTGHVVAGPRSRLAELLARGESRRAGVFLLIGADPEALGGSRCFVGEADEIRSALGQHHGVLSMDFWDRMVIITSKDVNLTRVHSRHLEARLIDLAVRAGRTHVENAALLPPSPPLPEADVSDMDFFVDQLRTVLPVLGVNVLRGLAVASETQEAAGGHPAVSPEFRLPVPKRGIAARAVEVDGEFTVLEGSPAARRISTGQFPAGATAAYDAYRELTQKLVDDGSLVPQGALARFTRDVVFSSPSTAGAIVTGRSCNGRVSWVSDTGLTFGEWEQRGVEDEGPAKARHHATAR